MIVSVHTHKDSAVRSGLELVFKYDLGTWIVLHKGGYAVKCKASDYNRIFGQPKTVLG